MGVIRRQSIKHSIVNMTGLVVGGVSTLFVYPHVLSEYGLFQSLLTVGIIGLPVLSLGANVVAIRYFPRFENPANGHNGFLPLLVTMCLAGWALGLLVVLMALPWIGAWLEQKSALLRENAWMAAPLSLLFILNTVLSLYSANFKRIVVPTILLDFSLKLAVPALLIGIWQDWIPVKIAVWLLLLHAVLALAGMIIYLRQQGTWYWNPKPEFLTPELRRDLGRFILFGALGGFALLMASRVDILMVTSLSTLKNSGIYSIAAYIAAAIDVPTKSLYTASVSSVAKYLAEDNRVELAKLYKQVSNNLLLAGLLMFGATWVSVDSLFQILPNGSEIAAGKYVLFFIGMARLAEMVTGLNNYMIFYSRYYLYSLITLGVMAVANIGLNLWLIPLMGLTGAALATLLSVSTYNLVSVMLVWVKFRLQPFTWRIFGSVVAALGSYGVAAWIPRLDERPLLDIMVHSGVYVLLFAGIVLAAGISPEINNLVSDRYNKIRGLFLRKNQ